MFFGRDKKKKLIGRVGIDAGVVIITDPSNIDNFRFDLSEFAEGKHKNEKGNYSYSGACAVATSPEHAGQLEEGGVTGVASATGYGDGDYPVYATYNSDGTIASVHIDFMPTNG